MTSLLTVVIYCMVVTQAPQIVFKICGSIPHHQIIMRLLFYSTNGNKEIGIVM